MALFVAGTLIVGLKCLFRPSAADQELLLRMRSWRIMDGLFILAIAVNCTLGVLFFALVIFLSKLSCIYPKN
ncbi:MAG: hypothetical protein ABL859_07380 [Methylotenera sp.]